MDLSVLGSGTFAHLCKPHRSFRGLLRLTAVLALLCGSLTTFASAALAQQGMFIPTGSMNTARELHTATLLNNGMVLIAGGITYLEVGSPLTSAELYDPTTGLFTFTGSMNVAHMQHTATLLNNGMVLIAGGLGNTNPPDAELYNPTTGTFTPTGSMNAPRVGNTATLLNNGMVLIAGGEDTDLSRIVASAELYDPTTGTFTPTGSMNAARSQQTATLLNNGMVLIAGGYDSSGFSSGSAELYDPATGTFTLTGSLSGPAYSGNTATLLKNGMVLMAGGAADGTSNPLATAQLYNPTTGTFTLTGSLNTGRDLHTATLLSNGTVLIAGGLGAGVTGTGSLSSAELYELFTVFPMSLSFSNQAVGTTSASQTVTLTNNESSPLSITSIAVSGANASDFAETNNCPGSVPAGASCSIAVTFTPTAIGSLTGNLTIANNLTVGPLAVPLTAMGVAVTRIASLSASSLTFANQLLGTTSAAQTLTLSNTGSEPLIVTSLAIGGTNGSDFAETDNCVGNVAAGANCTINVTFTPAAQATRTGALNISDNATSPQSPQTVTLSGTTAPSPSISVTPSHMTFPSQYVGTSGLPQSVTVTNTSGVTISIFSVAASPVDFGLLNACGNSIAAGASCAIGIFFDPTASGTRSGTLTITDNGAGSPQTVALSGGGQDFSLVPSGQTTATVTPGQTAKYTVAVTPGGGFNQTVTLSCSGAPAQSTCSVSPSPLTLSGTSASMATVTVTTAGSSATLMRLIGGPSTDNMFKLRLALSGTLGLALLVSLAGWRVKRRPWLLHGLAFLLLFSIGFTMSGCGGGSNGGSGGTPAGSYTLVVSGTFTSGSAKLTHNSNLTLVVQ